MQKLSNKSLVFLGLLFITGVGLFYFRNGKTDERTTPSLQETYNPQINPNDFSNIITNEYFNLRLGKKFVYLEQTAEGLERNEIVIEAKTRTIMGVVTLVYHDKVFLDGKLIEDTEDFLAQDKDGNVWYFGETVDNYENGVLVDHDGAWIAGDDGAQPGIWIKSTQIVGDSYRQEYYKGVAEDMTDVIAINETVTVPLGTFTGCVKMLDWTPLDPESKEYKYYCPEVGGLVLVENIQTGEKAELVEVTGP